MGEKKEVGYTVTGTIVDIKGFCHAGHQVGEQMELSLHQTGGLCGAFYHDIFPYVVMLQMGGGFPAGWGDPDIIELECLDRANAVKIELKRQRD